jgi:hypothetical protein
MAPTETKSENDLTIEQLAAETGMTVRNIRSHRARGLLPAPEVRDRVGYYGPEHLDRLRMIQELQTDGFNLKGVHLRTIKLSSPYGKVRADEEGPSHKLRKD